MSISDPKFPVLCVRLGLIKPTAPFDQLCELQSKLTDSGVIDKVCRRLPHDENNMEAGLVDALEALTPREAVELREELAHVLPFKKS